VTADMLPVVARVFPPGCGWPGCLHHYYRPRRELVSGGEPVVAGCICVAWPDARSGAHVVAVNPLCEGHHSVMEMIEDAADVLCMRGYLDPEGDEIPPEIVADLLDLYLAGQCGLCPGWPSPDNLAEHLLARKQEEWERFGIAPWWCDCGAIYKPLTEFGATTYYATTDPDGLLGDPAGVIKRNAKGQVKHSDRCPACARRFADTVADRVNPQQALF